MNDKVKYWTDLPDYDIETAKAILESKRYLYVGFMCHQAIEKIFKAYFSNFNELPPPYSHSLTYLAEKCNLNDKLSNIQLDFLNEVEPLNIEARYPSHKKDLLKSLTEEKCRYLLMKQRS